MSWTQFGSHWRIRNERRTLRIIDDNLVIEDRSGRQVMSLPDDKDRLLNLTMEEVMELI